MLINAAPTRATLINMETISGSTFSTVQHMQDLFHSAGWVSGGVVSDNGDDTVAVTAGTGTIRASTGATQEILFFDWALNNSLSVSANTTRYVGVEYNVGSPQLVVRTSNNFNNDTDFILASLINENSTIHIQKEEHAVGDHTNNMIQRLFDTSPFARDNRSGGLILGESDDNNRNLTMTAGTIWEKLNEFAISAIDTSAGGGDTFDRYLRDGVSGNHTKQSDQTTWDNTRFDSSGTLTTLDNNKYAVQWYYIELDGEFVSMYGTVQYNTEAEAETESPPTDIPDRISLHGKLIGRIIFQKSDTIPQSIESVFTQTFTAAGITSHNNLAALDYASAAHTGFLADNGSTPLTANWDVGNFTLTANGLILDGTFTDGTMSISSGNLSSVGTIGCGTITSSGGLVLTGVPSDIVSANVIQIRPSGDNTDYIIMQTVGDVPNIGTAGNSDFKITASSGEIDFDDDNLTTSGVIKSTSIFGLEVNTTGKGTNASMLIIGDTAKDAALNFSANAEANDADKSRIAIETGGPWMVDVKGSGAFVTAISVDTTTATVTIPLGVIDTLSVGSFDSGGVIFDNGNFLDDTATSIKANTKTFTITGDDQAAIQRAQLIMGGSDGSDAVAVLRKNSDENFFGFMPGASLADGFRFFDLSGAGENRPVRIYGDDGGTAKWGQLKIDTSGHFEITNQDGEITFDNENITTSGDMDAGTFTVGGVAGIDFSGAVTNITVIKGIVTAAS